MRHLTERLDAAQPVGLLWTRLVIGGLFVHHGIDTLLLLFAIYDVKLDLGIISSGPMPGVELDLAYIAALLTLITQGPGRWSWEHPRRRAHDDATAGEPAGAALPA